MSDDAWFNYYRGRGKMQIVPRNAQGWASFAALMVVILVPALAMTTLGDDISPWLVVAFVVLTLMITFLWIRWAIGRARRIDLDDIDRDYPDYLEWKRRHRRD